MYKTIKHIILVIITLFVIFYPVLSKEKAVKTPQQIVYPQTKATRAENIRNPQSMSTSYLLTVEGDYICAYIIVNGSKTVAEKSYIDTTALSPDELDRLTKGISAKSREELYQYYESYTSWPKTTLSLPA